MNYMNDNQFVTWFTNHKDKSLSDFIEATSDLKELTRVQLTMILGIIIYKNKSNKSTVMMNSNLSSRDVI